MGSSTSHEDDAVSLGQTHEDDSPLALIQHSPPLPHVLVAQGVVPDDAEEDSNREGKRDKRRRKRVKERRERRGEGNGRREMGKGKMEGGDEGGEKEEVERRRLLMVGRREGRG